MRRYQAWLVSLAAVTVAAAVVLLSGVTVAAPRIASALALALVLPGYALSAVVFPPGSLRSWQPGPWLLRGIWAAGLSLAASVLGGLILNLTPGGLTRTNWAVFLGALTLLAVAVALIQSWRRGGVPDPGQARRPAGRPRAPRASRASRARALAIGGCALGAVVLGIAAIRVAQVSAERHNPSDFAQLWLVPGTSSAATLGVRSDYPGEHGFRLVLHRGASVAATWDLALAKGQSWQRTVTDPAGQRLSAELTVTGRRGSPLSVRLTSSKGAP